MKVEFVKPHDLLKVVDMQPANSWGLLEEIHAIITDDDGTVSDVLIPAGYVTDFASVPRVPILFEMFGGLANKAAALHDWLYTVHSRPREWCDSVLRAAMLATGFSHFQAEAFYLGVRAVGGSHFFGWTPDTPDQRDRVYMVERLLVAPPSVDLRPLCPRVYDQGALGSCTANAIAAAIHFDRMKQNLLPSFIPSRLFIYYNEREMEGNVGTDSGAMLRDGIKSVAKFGDCPETLWNYRIRDFAVKPSKVCYTSAEKYKAVQYASILQNVAAMKQCLAQGYPFVFGFSVYESFESPNVASTGIVSLPTISEQLLGGHAVTCVGYDDHKNWFICRNSWGTRWGDHGYFYMPYEYLTDINLADDFWTIRLVSA